MKCIMTYYNYEIDDETLKSSLQKLAQIAESLGARLESLRYNLPEKYLSKDKTLQYALPQLFDAGYTKVVAFNTKYIPEVSVIEQVFKELETNETCTVGDCMGFSLGETKSQTVTEDVDHAPQLFNPFGTHLLKHNVPKSLFEMILGEVNEVKQHLSDEEYVEHTSHSEYLAGINSYQIRLNPEFVKQILQEYLLSLGHFYLMQHKQKAELVLGNVWINYTYGGDFNPLHTHDSLLSGVIYVKQDESIYREMKKYAGRTSHGVPGATHFVHKLEMNRFDNNVFSNMTVPGEVLMFPSWLTHYVNAHQCEGERITIAFNILEK